MTSNIAIAVRGVSKAYTIRHRGESHITLAESLLSRARHPFQRQEREQFWALKDVSFDVRQGEVLGIIGRNGAGKSTLLKILSRITAPTTGSVELYGRVGSLLEVGTGFHPELTGRENIYLNGAILGMRRSEIDRQFDKIVEFAGVERFLDTPVKRYSSGMYVRLAFAVAAHLRTEILIVDEVLAVGDAEFQKKCLGKIKQVAHDGRTVLVVSHNMTSIEDLTSSTALLDAGQLVAFGSTPTVIHQFIRGVFGEPTGDSIARARQMSLITLSLEVTSIELGYTPSTVRGNRSSSLKLALQVHANAHVDNWRVSGTVRADGAHPVGSFFSSPTAPMPTGATNTVEVRIELPALAPGAYSVDLALCSADVGTQATEIYDALSSVASFGVAADEELAGWDPRWGSVILSETHIRSHSHAGDSGQRPIDVGAA